MMQTYIEKHRAIGAATSKLGEPRDEHYGLKNALFVYSYAQKVQAAYDAGYQGLSLPEAPDKQRVDLFG